MISVYSFATSVLIFNFALVLVYFLRRRKLFLVRYGTQTLLLLTVLGIVRLFSPIDHELAYIVRSYTIIPAVQNVLDTVPISSMPGVSVGALILFVWALGTCVFVVKNCVSLYRHYRLRLQYEPFNEEHIEEIISEMDIKYPVIISKQVNTPYVAGFVRPRIYIPPLELTEDEWKYVLKHELQHLKSHDTAIKVFYYVIEAVFWWNPVSHLFMRELDVLLEMRCDINLASRMNAEERMDYLSAMLNVMKQATARNSKAQPVMAYFAESASAMQQRFEMVLDYDCNKPKGVRNLICAVIVVVFAMSYFVIFQPAYMPPMDDLTDTRTVTEETSFILFDGEKYYLYIDNTYFSEVTEQELNDAPCNALEMIDGSR